MYNTNTNTSTYTVIDIRKTFEGFEADLRIVARKTDKWEMPYTEDVLHDILLLAENKYLTSIDIVLLNEANSVVKALKYIINSQGKAVSSERAGKNNWENIPNTKLTIVLRHSDLWHSLSVDKQEQFKLDNFFKINWSNSSIDTSYSHLTEKKEQLYGSKGYELQKKSFN